MVWVTDAGAGSALVTLDRPEERPADPPSFQEAVKAHTSGDFERAMQAYQQIMGLDRDHVGAMLASALIQSERGEHDAAEFLLKRALSIAPTVAAQNILGHAYLRRRQFDKAVTCYRASLALDPSNLTTWPNLLFALDLHPFASPALRLAERAAFDAAACLPLTREAAPHDNDPDPDRPLRVGYVSADFKQHSAAHAFIPLIRSHDRGRIEVHLYDVDQSPEHPGDRVAAWFRALDGTVRHDVRGYDDATLAATIRADRIDILVDLSGYSSGGRPLVFARKPAPVQIGGFGYGTGLGIAAMDYLVADDVTIPPQHERWYRETVLRLPCYMPYELANPQPEIGPAPKERNGYVTYGYLGRSLKITPQTVAAWGQILTRVPTSRLLLKCGEYADRVLADQTLDGLAALGVDPERVEIRLATSRYDHLATYGDVDISLDPFPHGGGVTTVESFLMGVPTVTLLGDYFCGRTGAAILAALDLSHAVARTPFEYVNHAVSMADDTWTLADRRALRLRVQGSVMADQSRYVGAVEDAYREAWRRWCAGRAA